MTTIWNNLKFTCVYLSINFNAELWFGNMVGVVAMVAIHCNVVSILSYSVSSFSLIRTFLCHIYMSSSFDISSISNNKQVIYT